mmetsp:Transcript_1409/g.1932  ORF Transcript_1409/g.1932 Transcript_1409/m.1932 type:complete len:465 (-) Transcript_1409:311-1705(-)|eukprot:CAMPEP_0184485126 /NCGR_PEP_ID=MMETSP0113_2-20130426/6767_1 /TAXON_ID=91329 /ORGANISM="Norrisiella sphaerica, Strain BC52" /LENGTH=464 /DNA_ID=CAMNT_0026866435 /DNA_START=170 /DNA_END=1564 /DNA_ORIENTATION=-
MRENEKGEELLYRHNIQSEGKEFPSISGAEEWFGIDAFGSVACVSQVACIVLFALCVDYDSSALDASGIQTSNNTLIFFAGVAFMVLLGFAFLMTFLHRYALGSIGMTLLITATAIEWDILAEGFWKSAYDGKYQKIEVDVFDLVEGYFAAATLLISFGAIVGKIPPTRILLLSLLEVAIYALNVEVVLRWLKPADVGGTISIHLFGAFFGLSASYIWGYPPGGAEEEERTSRASDVFSMLGTLILWVLWPLFNAAAAPSGPGQTRAIINTVLSISSSCIISFAASRLSSPLRKFSPAEIQNSTLAGGVAIGAVANMIVKPWGAMLIGTLAGLVSVWGFRFLQPRVRSWGLHDTCGILNLHGIPALVGAAASIVIASVASENDGYKKSESDNFDTIFPHGTPKQGLYQLAATGLTLSVAVLGGAISSSIVLRACGPSLSDCDGHVMFRDSAFWEMDSDTQLKHL